MRELSLHILDLVQNAVEAGATAVRLEVSEDSAQDWLTIRVVDNGCGMDDCSRSRVTDPFYTTRSTRRVGLGLPLIDMSTARCGGRLFIASKPDQGTTVEATWRLSHLDRPPLGNLAATLKTLLVGNPELDLTYIHQVDGNHFSILSSVINEALAGIPLTQPDVLVWLDEYLNGNEQNVYGGAQNENG